MKYQDILPDVLAGKWVRIEEIADWMQMDAFGVWAKENGIIPVVNRKDYDLDTWEVKQDEPGEIYFWAASRSRGISKWANYISSTPQENSGSLNGSYKEIGCTALPWFNTGIPKRYKLIPVDEEIKGSQAQVNRDKEYFEKGRLAERKEGQLHTGSFHDWAAGYSDMVIGNGYYEFGQKVWDASRKWEFKG